MKYSFIFLISVLLFPKSGIAIAQDSIRVHVNLLRDKTHLAGWLEQFGAEKSKVLEFKIQEGRVAFALPVSIVPGIYRLHLDLINKKPFVDIIIDGKESNITCDIKTYGFEVYPVFHESVENKNWYSYLDKSKMKIERLAILFNYLSMFHLNGYKTDRSITRIYQKERKRYYDLFEGFVEANKNKWCGLLVKNRPSYFSDLDKKPIARDFIRKNFYWEDIDTNNSDLIHTPLYEELINAYLIKYYVNPIETYSAEEKEYNLKKAIDILLDKFSNNDSTKKFIQSYLKEYFEGLKMQDFVNYVQQKEVPN